MSEGRSKRQRTDSSSFPENAKQGHTFDDSLIPVADTTTYASWRSNVPCVYDTLLVHGLQPWAAMSCTWGNRVAEDEYSTTQTFYYSSRTAAQFSGNKWNGQPSEILATEVNIPKLDSLRRTQVNRFHESRQCSRLSIQKRIVHPGEVNRIRALPSNRNIVATHSDSPTVYVWNLKNQPHRIPSTYPSTATSTEAVVELEHSTSQTNVHAYSSIPELELIGHEQNAEYALDLGKISPYIISGGRDTSVLLWSLDDAQSELGAGTGGIRRRTSKSMNEVRGKLDMDGVKDSDEVSNEKSTQLQPRITFRGHSKTVNDCCINPQNNELLCSVSDDKTLRFWDCKSSTGVTGDQVSHNDAMNCVAWSPFNENLVLTGGFDRIISLWDRRKLRVGKKSKPVRKFVGHSSQVFSVQWSPHSDSHFASASDTGAILLWTLGSEYSEASEHSNVPVQYNPSRIETEKSGGIIMKHLGHRSMAWDVAWNPLEPWLLSSCSDDSNLVNPPCAGTLQVWRVSPFVYRTSKDWLS